MHQVISDPKLTVREVRAMRRLNDDDGAVAVVVAVLMVVAMLFAAVVIDVGAVYSERRQLQNGADAAALALARECALADGDTPCVATQERIDTARHFLNANANDGTANLAGIAIEEFAGSRSTSSAGGIFAVTVEGATKQTDGSDAVPHTFASFVGVDGATLDAKATAAWGAPSAAEVILPIAFHECVFNMSGDSQLIRYDEAGETECDPAQPDLPGAFAWLATDGSTCGAYIDSTVAQTPGQPGNSFPGECEVELPGLQNQVILLPIYDDAGGTGLGVWYKIKAFAAFRLTGYKFSGNSDLSWNNTTGSPDCNGNCRGVIGHFEEFVGLEDVELGGIDLGFSAIELVR